MFNKLVANVIAALFLNRSTRHRVRNAILNNKQQTTYNNKQQPTYIGIASFVCTGGIDWADYLLSHDMQQAMSDFRKGLDEKSLECLDTILSRLTILPKGWNGNYQANAKYIYSWQTKQEREDNDAYALLLPSYTKAFWLEGGKPSFTTFFYQGGLRNKSEALQKYIAGKVFIDGGAYRGDSVLVYSRYYHPQKIYSFEISPKARSRYVRMMEMNKIDSSIYKLIPMGLFDKKAEIMIENDAGRGSTSVLVEGDYKVALTDLDSFVQDNGIGHVGYIKCDLEGAGLEALRGMAQTIQRDRPIISMAIYHNPKEFFEVKPLLDKIVHDLDYKVTLERHSTGLQVMTEIVLFAYPLELDDKIKDGLLCSSGSKELKL